METFLFQVSGAEKRCTGKDWGSFCRFILSTISETKAKSNWNCLTETRLRHVAGFNNESISEQQHCLFWAERKQGRRVWKQLLNPTNKALPEAHAKGCSLRAWGSWLIPAQITIALSVSALPPSPSLTSPLLTAVLLIPPLKCPNPASSSALPWGQRERGHSPTECNWDLKTLNSSQAQNFSLGSREGILSSGPLCIHLIRRSVPSPSSFSPILLSRCRSGGLRGGLAISLTPNTAVNSFCSRPWLRKPDLENGSQQGVEGKTPPPPPKSTWHYSRRGPELW